MRSVFSAVWLALAVIPVFADTPEQRLLEAQKLPVPELSSTPYDSDPSLRAAYLTEYRAAYRSGLAAVDVGCHMVVDGPTAQASRDGWQDGLNTARKNHPDKAAALLGIPLEHYLLLLKSPKDEVLPYPQ